MQFGSMLVYCTVYDICVWGGPASIFFQGAPNPLATALLASPVFRSVSYMTCVKLKEFQLLYAAPLINAISKTVDQSEDLGGGASVVSFGLQ